MSKRYRLLGPRRGNHPGQGPGPAPGRDGLDAPARQPLFCPGHRQSGLGVLFRPGHHRPAGQPVVVQPGLAPGNCSRNCVPGFIQNKYDLKWLHRTILACRTYQQSSQAGPANDSDRSNFAYFYYRRLPAEVLVDALNQATGTTEKMEMEYHHWPSDVRTVEVPFAPRNGFVNFMLGNFGKPKRNSAVQCDCERDGNASVLQVLSLANHPRVLAKIADDKGQVARIAKEISEEKQRIEELYLVALGRLPKDVEQQACLKYLEKSESAVKGLQGILWSLLNTREFILQH